MLDEFFTGVAVDDGDEASFFWSNSTKLMRVLADSDMTEIKDLMKQYNEDANDPLWCKYRPALDQISPK